MAAPMENTALPRPAVLLGLSGILPQALCLVLAVISTEWQWMALAAGCFYAALILSFLGGLAKRRELMDQWSAYLGSAGS